VRNILLVGFGGMCGAIARYSISLFILQIIQPPFAFFTILVINLAGCLGIGFVVGLGEGILKPELRLLIVTGFLGGFTTYSAFAFDTSEFITSQQYLVAAMNIVLHIAAGLVAVWVGSIVARHL